jgi:hypothetical protein
VAVDTRQLRRDDRTRSAQNTQTPEGPSDVVGLTICRVGTTLPLALTGNTTTRWVAKLAA